LTVKDVAKLLHVCTRTVYEMVERGALPHVRVLNAIRVAPSDVEKLINGQRSR
jgi:excisionase family DNA binding protein